MKKLLLLMFSVTLIFMFSLSAIAQQGKNVKVANNNQLIEAIDNPTVKTIELAGGYYDYLDSYIEPGSILFKTQGSNGSRANCNYIITPSDTCFAPVGLATVMVDTAKADAQGTQGNPPLCPTANSGTWSVIDKPSGSNVNFHVATNQYVMPFDVDMPGVYTLKYSWGAPHNTYVQTEYKFYALPVVSLSAPAEVCGTSVQIDFGYTIDTAGGAKADTTVTWSITPSAGVILPDTIPPSGTLTVPNCGSYDLTLSVTHSSSNGCSTDAMITIDFYDTPVVNAGPDDTICGLVYTLTPSYTIGCYHGTPTTSWSYLGPGTATFSNNTVNVDTCGTYEFHYEVYYDSYGICNDIDTVEITFYDYPVVDAGINDTICGLQYILQPSDTAYCIYNLTTKWSTISVPPIGPAGPTFSGDTVNVPVCGTYKFLYEVWNWNCYSKDSVEITFYDYPVVNAGTDAGVCGLVYTLTPSYTVACPHGTPTTSWSYLGPGTATFSNNTVNVDTCGPYKFIFSVTNWQCETTDTVDIDFHEVPIPVIVGDTTVFVCGTNTYTVLELSNCNDLEDLEHFWYVECGLFENDDVYTEGDTVIVNWKSASGPGLLHVWATIKGVEPECSGDTILNITKIPPTLAGQVKYWNEFETYMPTPFPTNLYGTFPHDYFYVTLYEGTTDSITTVIVEPRLMPDLVELLSYFEFTLPIGIGPGEYDCDAEFLLRIWDGGLTYHQNPPPPPNSPTYLGASYTYNNWGGVNATDAQAIQYMAANTEIHNAPYNYTWVGLTTYTPPYGYYSYTAADVNTTDPHPYTTGGITALDALTANYRAVGLIANYPDNGSANQFSPNFRVTGRMVDSLPQMTWDSAFNYPNVNDVPFLKDVTMDYLYFTDAEDHFYASDPVPWEGDNNYINIYYLAIGDLNSSYVPTSGSLKAEPTMELIYEDQLVANQGDVLSIPISLDNEATLGALTLNLTYMNDLIEVIGTNYEKDFFNINHKEGYVRIGWFSFDAINVKANETIAILKLRVLADIEQGTRLFELDAMTELADASANRIDGVNFKALGVTTDKSALIGSELTANNYPNPFTNKTIISYMLPEAGKVQVIVYSKMGQIVSTIVDQSQDAGTQTVEFNHSDLNAGVYFYKITLNGQTKYYTVTKSMVVVK